MRSLNLACRLGLATLLACVWCALLPAQQAPPSAPKPSSTREVDPKTLRVDVDLVLVPTTVADPYGRLVSGLGMGQFRVFEDGVEQELMTVHEEDAPISVAIVFDVSGSMRPVVDTAREVALEFVRSANPNDSFVMIAFGSRAEVITDMDTTEEELRERLLYTSAKGMTAMLDGIYLGLAKLRSAPTQRRAMLVITDGDDNHSRYGEPSVSRALKEAGVQVYGVGYDALGIVRKLAELSGGRMFPFTNPRDTSSRIWAELRNQYVLAYRSSNKEYDGKWRKIKIRLKVPKGMPPLSIYAKSGYYAPQR